MDRLSEVVVVRKKNICFALGMLFLHPTLRADTPEYG